ncbi:S1 RNA-binding domain-containing protein, partial [Methylobacterium sp. WL12]|uniref:S1 RNA-binding domain-containing protein n=1 Tax=Methylobacterium sp. WL12 TaxID=2603890 RepID=UPI0011C7308B
SRRTVLEESRAEQRSELVANLEEGQVIDGVVKNITEYGAFVELEPGIEGLIHVSEMSWTKKNVHPGKIVSTSQEVEVQ